MKWRYDSKRSHAGNNKLELSSYFLFPNSQFFEGAVIKQIWKKLGRALIWRIKNFFSRVTSVPMTWKIFSAYLKGLSKYRRMAFFFLNYLFSFWRYWRFSIMQIRSAMTSYCLLLKMIKYWINDISGNIKAVFLKLGTINVHHKRNTMTPLMSLPWQQFGHWCCLNKN